MHQLSANTPVHVVWIRDNIRYHLHSVESKRRSMGELYLCGNWSEHLEDSKPFAYQAATRMVERFKEESLLDVRLTLTASEHSEFLD